MAGSTTSCAAFSFVPHADISADEPRTTGTLNAPVVFINFLLEYLLVSFIIYLILHFWKDLMSKFFRICKKVNFKTATILDDYECHRI